MFLQIMTYTHFLCLYWVWNYLSWDRFCISYIQSCDSNRAKRKGFWLKRKRLLSLVISGGGGEAEKVRRELVMDTIRSILHPSIHHWLRTWGFPAKLTSQLKVIHIVVFDPRFIQKCKWNVQNSSCKQGLNQLWQCNNS